MLEGPFDQSLVLSETDRKVFDEVDLIIGRSITAGDPLIALEYGRDLITQNQVRGLALAKLLYRLRENWQLFEVAGVGDSLEAMADVHIGRSPQTVTKYIRLWESVFANDTIPPEIRQQLMGRPIKDLLLITALAREGTDNETLQDIAYAPDHNSVRDIIKRERGGRTSSGNAIRLVIEMRKGAGRPTGTIWAYRNDEPSYAVGTLDVTSENETIQKAIARIINAAGISEAL